MWSFPPRRTGQVQGRSMGGGGMKYGGERWGVVDTLGWGHSAWQRRPTLDWRAAFAQGIRPCIYVGGQAVAGAAPWRR